MSSHPQDQARFALYTDARGKIDTATDDDGNGIITVTPAEGYRFVGWSAIDAESPLAEGDIEIGTSIAFTAEYAE